MRPRANQVAAKDGSSADFAAMVLAQLTAIRAEFLAELTATRAEITALRLERALATPPSKREWLTTAEAAKRATFVGTKQTIRNWVRRFGIGEKIGAQWRIDPDRLDEHLRQRGGKL